MGINLFFRHSDKIAPRGLMPTLEIQRIAASLRASKRAKNRYLSERQRKCGTVLTRPFRLLQREVVTKEAHVCQGTIHVRPASCSPNACTLLLPIRTKRRFSSLGKARNRRHATAARTPAHTTLRNICGRPSAERQARSTPSPHPTHRCSPEARLERSWTEHRSKALAFHWGRGVNY